MKDWDDLYIEYDELVEAGEIDPTKTSAEEWVTEEYADMCDHAYQELKDRMAGI